MNRYKGEENITKEQKSWVMDGVVHEKVKSGGGETAVK